jgi:hypothetical protein
LHESQLLLIRVIRKYLCNQKENPFDCCIADEKLQFQLQNQFGSLLNACQLIQSHVTSLASEEISINPELCEFVRSELNSLLQELHRNLLHPLGCLRQMEKLCPICEMKI